MLAEFVMLIMCLLYDTCNTQYEYVNEYMNFKMCFAVL